MQGAFAFDTETTGLDLFHGAEIFAWSACDEDGNVQVHRTGTPEFRKNLSAFWSSPSPKIAHNAKFDLTAVENYLGRSLEGTVVHDTRLMSHILQNHHPSHTLDHLAWELAGYERIDGKVKAMAAELGGFHKVPQHIMEKYQRLDAERCMALYLFFWPKIRANPKWEDCYRTEIELVRTTIRMERRGLMVHKGRTLKMISELEQQAETAREEIFQIVGRRFNPDSDLQIRKVLYGTGKGQFGFPVLARTSKSKEPALDKRVLLELRDKTHHPIFDAILKARAYAKGVTVLQGYLDLAGAEMVIHPTINTCAAITGRQSSQNPNLQNVQKSGKLDNPYPVLARKAFRPRPGYVNIHIDYSGIEMRLLVHYSGEPEMLKCMNEGDGDVHALGAEEYYQDAYKKLPKGPDKKALRNRAKNGGFAQAYGASPVKLAQTLGLDPKDGSAAYNRYKARFPRLGGLSRSIIKTVKEQGHMESVFGRRLHVPKSEAYIGTNYLIQGTAGEILKRAEVRIDRYNREHTGDEVKLLLPIHDEIIIEYPRSRLPDLPDYLRDVRKQMIDFPQFNIPLEVEAELATSSWEQKTPCEIIK